MSEYQQRKARALELQKQREAELKREIEAKAAQDKLLAKNEEEKRRQREAAAKEARRLELMRANEALNKKDGDETKRGEWDPFAEDERRPLVNGSSSKPTQSKVKTANGSPAHRAGPSKPRPAGHPKSTPRTRDSMSPPALGRKEKAARLFAQKAKKASAAENIFSVRSLVEGRDSPAPVPGSGARAGTLPAPKARQTLPKGGFVREGFGGGVKDTLKRSLAGEGMRKLCPDRDIRDRRTIDEIQKDIKARKVPVPEEKGTPAEGKKRSRSDSPVRPARVKPVVPSTARPVPSTSRPIKRRPSTSSSSTTSSSTTSEDSPPRKRPRDVERDRAHDWDRVKRDVMADEDEDDNPYSQSRISAEIQALFRRPGRPQPKYADSDASSDMEAGLSDVEQEERRTAKIARKEDELAEREEKARKEAKERLKRERERKGR